MKRTPIHSRAARRQRSGTAFAETAAAGAGHAAAPAAASAPAPAPAPAPASPRKPGRLRGLAARHERALLALSSALLTALCFLAYLALTPPQQLTQKDIDAAVMHTLNNATLPSPEAKAFAKIRPSVVRVVQEGGPAARGKLRGVGTGVVIVDNGTILTSLHVIEGAGSSLKVRFYDGSESSAVVLKRQPESDLAVIRATHIPDDLLPATLRSTNGLAVGEKVVAVGFPFNIGPSASSGIVSGLHRVYESPDHSEVLKDLIQFDAAANPGNSGGPLITMDGEVVGIVTAILSPHQQGTFIGIGFAVPIETAAGAVGESPF